MAPSDDQKALLRLLAQREEGYDDIAALLGLSVGEVRARVKGALAELDSAAPAVEAPRQAPSPPPAPEPTEGQEAPRVEPATPAPSQPSAASSSRLSLGRLPALPKSRQRLFELGGGILVVALIVLFATGALNIGGGGGSDGGASSASAKKVANGKATQAVLSPPGGGDAVGLAVFGRVGKGPVLEVIAEGLAPTNAGESYTVWLYKSRKLVLRVGAVNKVNEKGGFAARLPIPVELFSYLAGGAFNQIYVSRTDDAQYAAEVAQAKKQKRLPPYTGTTVLSGEIVGPLVRK